MNTILSLLSAFFYLMSNTFDLASFFQSNPISNSSAITQTRLMPTPHKSIALATPMQSKAAVFKVLNDVNSKVDQLSKKAPQLNKKVLKFALVAYQKASAKGTVKKPVLTVIDYSLPSSKQRMWIFDVKNEKLLYNTYVAHGMNSGMNTPNHFSNKSSSKQTSLGTYVTRDTYIGSKGLSLNLQGLEKGFNDNAYSRRVVIHGAWYVEPDFIKKTGRAGRSWGCPSIAQTLARPVINTIKDGSVVFAYYPDRYYLSHSGYLIA